jgi:molecular chaperone DnaJ
MLSAAEMAYGGEVTVYVQTEGKCSVCRGGGASTEKPPEPCAACNGKGKRARLLRSRNSSVLCETCKGRGWVAVPCEQCSGDGKARRAIRTKIPAGIKNGGQIKLPGKGMHGPKGTEPGDLVLRVHMKP